jgi:hypothetical protein
MRKFFTLLWLLFPVAVLTYHFNEGPRQIALEKARQHVEKIHALEQVKDPDWEEIQTEYDKLAGELPKDGPTLVQHQIRLAKAKARLEMLDVAGSIEELTALLKETAVAHGEDAPITRATRETLGKAYYDATYLLKTNGAAEEEWRPFAERTRQIFRFLAEHQEPAALARYEERVRAEVQKTIEKRSP